MSRLVDIPVKIVHQTEMAVLVDHGGDEPVWLPLSRVEIRPNDKGTGHTLTLPEYCAIEKELI
jgi:hypothetical protein